MTRICKPGKPARELEKLQQQVVACTRCPRLVEYRGNVARVKRRMFRDWEYWESRCRASATPTPSS